MSGQKRKRQAHNEIPNKKPALQSSQQTLSSSVKVSLLPEAEKSNPIVASTPGIAVQSTTAFAGYEKTRSIHSSANPQSSVDKSELLLHSTAHSCIDYQAREQGSLGPQRHYVGVFDPQAGSLQLVEARHVTIRGSLRPEEIEVERAGEVQTNRQRREDLGREFGTKKAQKSIASLTENAITTPKKPANGGAAAANGRESPTSPLQADPAAAAMLESIADTTKDMATREELQQATDESKPRPKANLAASTPQDVYPLNVLITEEELKDLRVRDWQTAVENREAVNTKSLYVSRRLAKVVSSGNVRKLKALRYLLLLLDIHAALLPGRNRTEKKLPHRQELREATEAPDSLIDSVRRRFTPTTPITKWHIDNMLTHIAAISLHIDNDFPETSGETSVQPGVDIFDIREDLRLETRALAQYYQEIGCKVALLNDGDRNRLGITNKAEASQHRIAKLLLPLKFPSSGRRRPAGGRRR